MFIKVCGIQSREQIDWAVELGYSAVGVVVHPDSVRYCDHSAALDLARHARHKIASVAVGVSFNEVDALCHEYDFVQIYEYKEMDRLILAGTELPAQSDYTYFLYDAGRGSGEFQTLPDWLFSVRGRLIVSGGLNAGNIAGIIREFRPFGVDVSSGVEVDRGIKDYNLMKKFIAEVNNEVK